MALDGHTQLCAQAKRLLITADSGGSNGARVRLWKWAELPKLADEIELEISVCHFPPGTSKWDEIDHRLFSFISQNWRGKPLISHQEVIINLIAATTTADWFVGEEQARHKHLSCRAKGFRPTDGRTPPHTRDKFHGDWNYSLLPRPRLLSE